MPYAGDHRDHDRREPHTAVLKEGSWIPQQAHCRVAQLVAPSVAMVAPGHAACSRCVVDAPAAAAAVHMPLVIQAF